MKEGADYRLTVTVHMGFVSDDVDGRALKEMDAICQVLRDGGYKQLTTSVQRSRVTWWPVGGTAE